MEEDNFNFEAVSSTTVFPVFCQPLLVSLNTVDENTKFVKFSLNKTIQVSSLLSAMSNRRGKIRTTLKFCQSGSSQRCRLGTAERQCESFLERGKALCLRHGNQPNDLQNIWHLLTGLSQPAQWLEEQIGEGKFPLKVHTPGQPMVGFRLMPWPCCPPQQAWVCTRSWIRGTRNRGTSAPKCQLTLLSHRGLETLQKYVGT